MKLQAKQVFKLFDTYTSVAGFATTNGVTTEDATVEIQAALAGLVEQVATVSTHGVVTTTKIEMRDNVTKEKIAFEGREVYARITGTAGAWTISYYYLDVSGVEQAYTSLGETIQFDFIYRYELHELPVDAMIRSKMMIYDDVKNTNGYEVAEEITVAVQNTVPDVSFQPNNTTTFKLMVNGKEEHTLGATPPVTASIANTTVVWNTANAGYNLDTTDNVIARYYTFG
jgi:hypothetical protein